MSLPTNRMPGDIIEAVDINQIAETVNQMSDSVASVPSLKTTVGENGVLVTETFDDINIFPFPPLSPAAAWYNSSNSGITTTTSVLQDGGENFIRVTTQVAAPSAEHFFGAGMQERPPLDAAEAPDGLWLHFEARSDYAPELVAIVSIYDDTPAVLPIGAGNTVYARIPGLTSEWKAFSVFVSPERYDLTAATWRVNLRFGGTNYAAGDYGDFRRVAVLTSSESPFTGDTPDVESTWEDRSHSWEGAVGASRSLRTITRRSVVGGIGERTVIDAIKDLEADIDAQNTEIANLQPRLIATPAPVDWPGLRLIPTPNVYLDPATLRYRTDLDINALRPAMTKARYVAPSPPSGRNGLTPETAMRVSEAFLDNTVDTLLLLPGVYYREFSAVGNWTRDVSLIAAAPGVRVTNYNTSVPWTVYSGSIYQASRAGTVDIVDQRTVYSHDGIPFRYAEMSSLAEITEPGQWFTDGATVYVWPLDNVPATNGPGGVIQLAMGTSAGAYMIGGNNTFYMEGVTVEGGNNAYQAGEGSTLIMRDCTLLHSNSNGVEARGGLFIGERVTVLDSGMDAFNYHEGSYGLVDFIEIDCVARWSGFRNTANNNGSSGHETVRGLRINGVYGESHGPLVVDVNNSQTWSIGTHAYRQGVEGWMPNAAGYFQCSGPTNPDYPPAAMWVENCTGEGWGIFGRASSGGRLYVRNEHHTVDTDWMVDSSSTLARY